ncbi:MAG: universal stress protein [Alphaproteobacteria bacterium]|nr:universal stress protein [Alphaproteobacteria bacterium]
MYGILVATDGSKNSDCATDVAADLAKKTDCDLLLVNVAHQPPRAGYSAEDLYPRAEGLDGGGANRRRRDQSRRGGAHADLRQFVPASPEVIDPMINLMKESPDARSLGP